MLSLDCKSRLALEISVFIITSFIQVYGDPDMEEKDHGEASQSYYLPSTPFTAWYMVGIILAILLTAFLSCLLCAWIKYCAKRRRGNQGASSPRESPDVPKVITLTPPSYISAEPPPYTAPDYSKPSAGRQGDLTSTEGQGHKNQCFSLDATTLPVPVLPDSSRVDDRRNTGAHDVRANEQPPSYDGITVENTTTYL